MSGGFEWPRDGSHDDAVSGAERFFVSNVKALTALLATHTARGLTVAFAVSVFGERVLIALGMTVMVGLRMGGSGSPSLR